MLSSESECTGACNNMTTEYRDTVGENPFISTLYWAPYLVLENLPQFPVGNANQTVGAGDGFQAVLTGHVLTKHSGKC